MDAAECAGAAGGAAHPHTSLGIVRVRVVILEARAARESTCLRGALVPARRAFVARRRRSLHDLHQLQYEAQRSIDRGIAAEHAGDVGIQRNGEAACGASGWAATLPPWRPL